MNWVSIYTCDTMTHSKDTSSSTNLVFIDQVINTLRTWPGQPSACGTHKCTNDPREKWSGQGHETDHHYLYQTL